MHSISKCGKAFVFAAVLFALGLVSIPVIGLYFRDNVLDIANFLVLFFLSLFLITTGTLWIFCGKTPSGRKNLAFAYVTLFISLLLLEIGLHIIVFAFKPAALVSQKGMYEYLIDNPIFKDRPDAKYFLKEWSDTKMIFRPFVVWDRKEFKGRYFNISKDGVRHTWNPQSNGKDALDIYVFGGSTMWGSGVSDNETIASYLSKHLNADHNYCKVTNYGEVGYSFAQEVIQLLLLLREGHRPDYVIFYDGVNDVYAGYQAGKAELIMNAEMISEKLEDEEPTAAEEIGQGLKKAINDHFLLYKSFRLLVGKFQKPFTEEGSDLKPSQIERLACSINESFRKTYKLLEIMADTYGFDFVCFWQPCGHLETKLFEEEYNSHPRFKDKTLKTLTLKTTECILTNPPPKLFDITDALEDRKTFYYFDSIHLCPEGNQTVATRMADVLQRELLLDRKANVQRTDQF